MYNNENYWGQTFGRNSIQSNYFLNISEFLVKGYTFFFLNLSIINPVTVP